MDVTVADLVSIFYVYAFALVFKHAVPRLVKLFFLSTYRACETLGKYKPAIPPTKET